MKKSLVLLFGVLCFTPAFSQLMIQGGVTYNTFDMSDMKALQKELFDDPQFDVRITDSFRPFFGYHASMSKFFENEHFKLRLGAIVNTTSTGGRRSYSDYSGTLRADQILNLTGIGIIGGIERLSSNQNWSYGLELSTMYDMTSFKLESKLIIDGKTIDEQSISFKANGLSIQPALIVVRNFKSFGIGLSSGYYLPVINEKLVWTGDDKSSITLNSSDEPLKAQWNGFRFGLFLRYKITV